MSNKVITPRNKDFSKWYTDVVMAAKLADYSPVRGCMIFEPNGYAIWENIQKISMSSLKSWALKMSICRC